MTLDTDRMVASSISVAIVTCHRPLFLEQALRSVMQQTLLPTEIIVSEDGIDPETQEVIALFATSSVVLRHLRHDPPLGQLQNRNFAMRSCKEELIAMLDDDDMWHDHFLEYTAKALEAEQDCAFCSTDHWLMDERGEVLFEQSVIQRRRFGREEMPSGCYRDVFERELRHTSFPLQFTLFRKEALESVGFFPDYAGAVPDLGLFLTLGKSGYEAYYIAKPLGLYRVHGRQQTTRRVQNARSLVHFLSAFSLDGTCSAKRARMLGQAYRQAVVECAIALAHESARMDALRMLRAYSAQGFGIPSIRRIIALMALLCGARQVRRTIRKECDI